MLESSALAQCESFMTAATLSQCECMSIDGAYSRYTSTVSVLAANATAARFFGFRSPVRPIIRYAALIYDSCLVIDLMLNFTDRENDVPGPPRILTAEDVAMGG